MAAFVFRKAPEDLPEATFLDAAGKERTLADWRGKVVLLNLWATWCLPCRKEMPALDRLQREMGSDRFQVVAVSVDRTGLAGAKKFLDETKAETLALYADPTARMATTLRAAGLPATFLLDREGREIGRLLGPAEWDGEDAKRLIGGGAAVRVQAAHWARRSRVALCGCRHKQPNANALDNASGGGAKRGRLG